MDSGILDVKLVPAWNAKEVQLFLKHSLKSFDLLQAGVAYWTINHKIFGDGLTRILSHKDSFACVDLHAPTDIDSLAALAREQRRVYFYFEDIATVSDWGKKEPPCLVHAKILLFWKKDRSAQLWVGSHNWTNRALYGLNVEASLVVMLRDSSRLFLDVFDYLGKIRAICDEFDPSKVDFYKQLQQKATGADYVIELEGKDAASVGNERIWLFGSDVEDLKQLGVIGREVHVSVSDTSTGREYLYPATIEQSGHLSPDISFGPRPHAFRPKYRLPTLVPKSDVARDVLLNGKYFVSLRLDRVDTTLVADPVPPRSAALERIDSQLSPLLSRLDASTINALFRGKTPRVRRPVPMEAEQSVDAMQTRAVTLEERRSLPQRKLVTKRILRRIG